MLTLSALFLVGAPPAQAQATDKPAQVAPKNTQGAAKVATPARSASPATRAGTDAGRVKVEGVSTQRSTPTDAKKGEGGCHSTASDA
jgi:hypothetical protein